MYINTHLCHEYRICGRKNYISLTVNIWAGNSVKNIVLIEGRFLLYTSLYILIFVYAVLLHNQIQNLNSENKEESDDID